MLGTIHYWKTRRQAQQSMEKKKKFKIGDLVKIRNHQRTKLESYFLGSYIIKNISWNTVQLQNAMDGTKLERKVHIKNILPFNE